MPNLCTSNKKMSVHLFQHLPAEAHVAGPEAISELVRHGISRAAAHAICTKRDVTRYIELCMRLGRDFDTDPRFPWGARILSKRQDPTLRVRTLVRLSRNPEKP